MYKARPITNKTKGSPFKMSDEALVQNDAQIHKKFVDAAGAYAAGRENASANGPKPDSEESPKEALPKIDNDSISKIWQSIKGNSSKSASPKVTTKKS